MISSFSPVINTPMRDYLERGVDYLGNLDRDRVGHLVNNTIGKHLPSLFKRFNYKHVSSLAEHEYGQMHFHISHVLNSDRLCYLKAARPCRTSRFINTCRRRRQSAVARSSLRCEPA